MRESPLGLAPEQVARLRVHLGQIAYSLLSQVTHEGIVLSRDADDEVFADLAASHHVVDLLSRLDARIFGSYIRAIAQWFADAKNKAIETQFAADVLVQAAPDDPQILQLVEKTILPSQLESGAFTRYTAYLHGGDFFSTLWCVRILLNAGQERYKDALSRAFRFLLSSVADAAIPPHHVGFLLMLLVRAGHSDLNQSLVQRVVSAIADTPATTGVELVNRLYLLEDLHSIGVVQPGVRDGILRDRIVSLFDLNTEADKLPAELEVLKQNSTESVVLQGMACACKLGLFACTDADRRELAYDVNSLLLSIGRRAKYLALQRDAELKVYLRKYGGIHKEFRQYDDQLTNVWEKTPFEKSVFIMMPFRKDVRFTTLSNCIKKVCAERAYTAIRIDDKERSFADRLWDNLVINMLSCEYAIAVYVSEKVVNVLDRKGGPDLFSNPNVALEFGFFKSRGQKILLLRDRDSDLPSDLQGFRWHAFDISDPEAGVREAVSNFLDDIELEKKPDSGETKEE